MPVHCTDYTFCGMKTLPSPLITKGGADISHLAFPQVRCEKLQTDDDIKDKYKKLNNTRNSIKASINPVTSLTWVTRGIELHSE